MAWLDEPFDPNGHAITELRSDKPYRYCCATVKRIFFTNSKKRWKRHYRLCKKRNTPGTWLRKDNEGVFVWHRIILSDMSGS